MSRRLLSVITLLAVTFSFLIPAIPVQAVEELKQKSLKVSNNLASETSTYVFSFEFMSNAPVATITMQFCANNPYPNFNCITPPGFDISGAVLESQTGNTGFSIAANTTANRMVLQRNGANANLTLSTYTFSNVVNPSVNSSYFVRLQTYATTTTNPGTENNVGGLAYVINESVKVTAVVPPYLLFCVGVTVNGFDCENVVGDYVNFGEFSSRQASQGTTQMLAATNAIDGYTIRVNGPTLTSGNNIIPNLVGSDISRPGVSQFGLNLRANSSPQGGVDVAGSGSGLPTNGYNQINSYRFNAGDVVAVSDAPDLARKYTSTYLVNIDKSQAPGAYVSTMTYIALGSF